MSFEKTKHNLDPQVQAELEHCQKTPGPEDYVRVSRHTVDVVLESLGITPQPPSEDQLRLIGGNTLQLGLGIEYSSYNE